jgi:hypothetical protein
VYVSWNGASEVVSWRLLTGASPASLAQLSATPKSGFETALTLPASAVSGYVEAQALNSSGAVIGTSAVTRG